jgi:hypothetical protein
MSNEIKMNIINALAESLDVPDSAYEAAVNRYHDLGGWLMDASKAKTAQYSPDVFPQGSFRLGTVTRPWKREDYDLDLACTLKAGVTKTNCSQEVLKQLLGTDLNAYREERHISESLEEKHRCWRLYYQDHLQFHMDSTPSIPQSADTRRVLQERMIKAGSTEALALDVANLAIAITDDRHPKYREISGDWLISNPKGYAKWFESRMRQAKQFLESRAIMEKVAKVDDLPTYKWKTPLQRCVQILKRHRDVMFERSPDRKPISVIITTLAARAYQGESDIQTAMETILNRMDSFVNPTYPRIPNPVNPHEDFADRWGTEEGRKLGLEQNFGRWLEQARSDFDIIVSSQDRDSIADQAMLKYGARLEDKTLAKIVGAAPAVITAPKSHHITDAAKPWRR